ncbi:hypothetical protein D3C72_1679690 [compost metagenome]
MCGIGVFGTGQPVIQISQHKHCISGIQRQCLILPLDMKPAMPLHNQVEAGPRQTLSTGVPATAITADMKKAGL